MPGAFEFLADPRLRECAQIALGATGWALVCIVILMAMLATLLPAGGRETSVRISLAALLLSAATACGVGLVLSLLSRVGGPL